VNLILTLSSILGLGFASGVNLYAAILVVGIGERMGWLSGLPGELSVLANPIVLAVAGFLYFLEFFADKIPFVSVAWDSIHTVIRPLGGAALALASASKLSPEMQALALLAGGSLALGSHSTKMGYRLLVHASPEPVTDSIFSVAEDFGVVGLVLLTYKHRHRGGRHPHHRNGYRAAADLASCALRLPSRGRTDSIPLPSIGIAGLNRHSPAEQGTGHGLLPAG
jgi:hypothetical protein